MGYVGNQQTEGFSQVPAKQDLTGAIGTSLTLTHAVASAEGIDLFINNVRQEPTEAYSVGGDGVTVTLTGSVVAADDIYVVYNSLARQTSTHPSNQALQATSGTFSGTVTANAFSGNGSSLTGVGVAGISSSSTSGTAVSIDANNIVTMPYQPCFHAYKSDGDISSATPVVYVFNNAIVNVGNHYSTSTGRYTAGVAGNYHFSCQILNRNTTAGGRMHFYKNGSPYFTVGTATSATYNNVSGEATLGASAVIYLAAGDYVEIKVWAANGDFYGSGNCHNSFSGFLIG